MTLWIRALSLRNEALSQAIVGRFDERGGTIGRSDSNTLALPDPERHISRLQAEVLCRGGQFLIRNVGSASVIVLNGQPARPGDELALTDGDELVVGGYRLRVESQPVGGRMRGRAAAADARTVVAASTGEARTDPPGDASRAAVARFGLPPAAVSSNDDPFGGLLGLPAAAAAASGPDPFADLLGPAVAPPARSPGPGPGLAPIVGARPAPPASVARDASPFDPAGGLPSAAAPMTPARIPDDFDPFAEPMPVPPIAAGPLPQAGEPPVLEDWVRSNMRPAAVSPRLDDLFDLVKPDAATPALDPLQAFLASSPAGQRAGAAAPNADDPLALLNADEGLLPGTEPAIHDHRPDLESAWSPPDVVDPDRPRPVRKTPPPPSADDDLWRAFCRGAGLPELPLPQGLRPELMQVIGEILHHAVTGAIKLSAVRTAARQELRVPVTTIQAKHNNPLKFAADPTAALAQLVQPPIRGFMPGPDAMRDLMDDLVGHAIASMSGTRAALGGVLQRFEPPRLESRLAPPGVLDALVPMSRRARLWELYLEHHREVAEAAQEDFHELFGRAFVKAYEEQLDRMAAARARPRR